MNVEFNTGVFQVDVPLLKGRIPQNKRDEVLDAVLDAASRYPLDRSTWEPLRGKLGGFYKAVFCSGLNNPDTKDMRMALVYDPGAEKVTVVAVGFRDARQSPDFYQRLLDRLATDALATSSMSKHQRKARRKP